MTAAQELEELRKRVVSELTTVGSGPPVKAGVQSLANLPLPLAEKYRHIDAAAIVRGNATGSSRSQVLERMGRLVKALNVLEKYGCNLTNPSRPRYWRSVKHNNPIFKAQVDGMQGGRGILYLYGYTTQKADGLCFPDEVTQPDKDTVAKVTVEVMCLRLEVDMLVKGTHPHPELFTDAVPLVVGGPEVTRDKAAASIGGVNEARTPPAKTPLPTPTKTALPMPTKTALPTPTETALPTPTETALPTPTKTPPAVPPKSPALSRSISSPAPKPTPPVRSDPAVTPPKPAARLYSWPPPAQEPHEAPPSPPPSDGCNVCGGVSTVACVACSPLLFCDACDALYHGNHLRANHKRRPIQPAKEESCSICGTSSVDMDCASCVQRFCLSCDKVYHTHPGRAGHKRTAITPAKANSSSAPLWTCGHCSAENLMRAALCAGCERPRLATPCPKPRVDPQNQSLNTEWQCRSCTMINQGCNALCSACERPRRADRPAFATPTLQSPTTPGATPSQWTCQYCTYRNPPASSVCEMCDRPSRGEGGAHTGPGLVPPQPLAMDGTPAKDPPKTLRPGDLQGQKGLGTREDSLRLIKHIKDAEKRGLSPEEVCAALVSCEGTDIDPCDWLQSELPGILDQICATATSTHKRNYDAEDSGTPGTIEADGEMEGPRSPHAVGGAEMRLSIAEARRAWVAAGGDVQKAVKQLLGNRKAMLRELHSLGFQDEEQCQEALLQSGGEVRGALPLLQWPLMEPFHQHINADQSEALIDATHPDKQRTCRRLLAFYGLNSWGRCELALSLLQEEGAEYTLEDVVQAVKESQDREFISRILRTQCLACTGNFPRNKMQSLISCQCLMCLECFKGLFSIAVKEKHVMDMVCQFCNSLDINDPEQMQTYFSTLDIQLRDCLDQDVFDIFTKKLMEHTLMKDPKFLWCCHCTFGFIYVGDQLKVTCFNCQKCFCAKCKKPWETQHQDLSCEMFMQWKRDNDPEWQKQGLAGFLLENGINCPSCGFQYALAKGGCMHFTCTRCKHQFCSGCNSPFHKTVCKNTPCAINGLHAHHPRDCLFYLRDWEPRRLQDLLQKNGVGFNVDPPNNTENGACSVMQQKEELNGLVDLPCGVEAHPGQAGLCEKHYREYLVSLINDSSLDPATAYDPGELMAVCLRYRVMVEREENEDEDAHNGRLLEKLQEVPLGDKVPRRK